MLRKITYYFLLIFIFISSVSAEDFVKIEGSGHDVDLGEMVVLRAVVDNSKIPSDLDINKCTFHWSITPDKNYIVWPDGRQIFFAAGIKQGKYTVGLTVMGNVEIRKPFTVFGADNKEIEGAKVVVEGMSEPITEVIVDIDPISSDQAKYEVNVGGSLPNPPGPGPSPNPNPPDFPAGKYNLAKTTYDLVINNVPASGKLQAPALAKSFRDMADRIQQSITKLAAGVALTDEDQKLDTENILKSIRESNSRIFLSMGVTQSDKTAWSKWNDLYGDYVYDLYKNGKIQTGQDWMTAFQETAQGMAAVTTTQYQAQIRSMMRTRNGK